MPASSSGAGGTIAGAPDVVSSTAPGNAPGAVTAANGYQESPQSAAEATNASQSTTEPTVLSSANISENTIPDNNDTLDNWDTGGVTVGEDGLARYSDGSFAAAPSGSQQAEDGTYTNGGISYAIGPDTSDDPDVQAMYDSINSAKSASDANTLAQIQNIESQYKSLMGATTAKNSNAAQVKARALLLGGTTQYAPLDAAGISQDEISAGLGTISDLQTKENSAIASAQAAQSKNDQELLDQYLTIAKSVQTQKQSAAAKLSATLSAAQAKQTAATQAAAANNAIVDQIAGGTTDIPTIISNLTSKGITVTSPQIATVIKNMTPTTATGDVLKFTSTQAGKMIGAGISSTQIQALSDYYNGKGDSSALTSLTPAQQTTVQDLINPPAKVKATAAAKSYASGTMTYTSSTLGTVQSWLDATKGSDGYVDPNAYQKAFDSWTADGGLAKDFLKNFPPKSYINPANDWLPQYLESKTTSSSASSAAGISQSEIDSLFSSPS